MPLQHIVCLRRINGDDTHTYVHTGTRFFLGDFLEEL